MGPEPCRHGHLFAVEVQAGVVRHLRHDAAWTEQEAAGHEGIGQRCRRLLLRQLIAADALELEDAEVIKPVCRHHGQGVELEAARQLEAVRIHAQHRLRIQAGLPCLHQVVIPVLHSPHVAVDLQQKVLSPVELLGLMPRPAGPPAVFRPERNQSQAAILREGCGVPGCRIAVRELKADPEAQPLGLGGPFDEVVQCRRQIRISVSRDLNKDAGRRISHAVQARTRVWPPCAGSGAWVPHRARAARRHRPGCSGRPPRLFPRCGPSVSVHRAPFR